MFHLHHNLQQESFWGKTFLVCKVAKRVKVFPSEWEVCKRFLQNVVSFSRWKCLKREFFELFKTSTLNFVKVCRKEFFDSLKVWGVWKRGLWVVESIKGVKDFFQSLLIFWDSVCYSFCVQNVFFLNGILESHGQVRWWQLSPLEVPMRMMLSKHGLWKFVEGSATLPSEEVARVDYISWMPNLHTFNIVTMWKVRGKAFCGVHEAKTNWQQIVPSKKIRHHQNARRKWHASAH